MQILLPTHLRPLYTATLHLTLPVSVDFDTPNLFNSFPSDHASLLFGFATTIWLVNRRLGVAAFIWAAVLNLCRIYDLLHFPSDIAGGACLGALLVCLAQGPSMMRIGNWLVRWEGRSPAWFYMIAFVGSYLSATLFDDARTLGAGAFKVLAPWVLG
jgi:undecaprenyl-diphosphatase